MDDEQVKEIIKTLNNGLNDMLKVLETVSKKLQEGEKDAGK